MKISSIESPSRQKKVFTPFTHKSIKPCENTPLQFTVQHRLHLNKDMIAVFMFLMAFHGLCFGLWQRQDFRKTSIVSYDILEPTKMVKAVTACCSFCQAKHSCHGVIHDGKTACTLLTNVITSIDDACTDGPTEAWIREQIVSKKRKFWLLTAKNMFDQTKF